MYFNNLGKIVSGGKVYSYDYIRDGIKKVKRIIEIERLGSQVVGIALPRTELLLITIFAMLESGIPFLLIDSNLPEKRLNYMIENAGIKKVLTLQSYKKNKLKKVEYIEIDNFENKEIRNNDISKVDVNDIAYVIYTSGTTGLPKGVEIKRIGLFNFIDGVSEAIDFSGSKTIICLTSVTFDIFFLETIFALIKGLTVVLANEEECNNPDKIIKLMLKYNVDTIQMTPSRLKWLYVYSKSLAFLEKIKIMMIGGETFPQELLEKLQASTNAKIYNMYGPTETTIWSTISNLTNATQVTIGQPINNTTIYILDNNLCEVENGTEGEICIAGEGLAKGYINNEDQTNSRFVYLKSDTSIMVYRTGDRGKYEGEHLLCLGREDNQVKCRGYRIELDEIDYRLSSMVGIEAAVTCYFKNDKVEELMVFYIANSEVTSREFVSHLNEYLPKYMVPSRYIRVSAFDYTESGKTDRKKMISNFLLSEERNNINGEVSYDDFSAKIIEICESILNRRVDTILNEEFECIGMDSISFVKIVVQIEEDFDFEFEMEHLMGSNINTIKELADYAYSCVCLDDK